jgi:hypothetical protein
MIDYPNQIFETVYYGYYKSESPSLTYEESNRLYQEVLKRLRGRNQIPKGSKKSQRIFQWFASEILVYNYVP